MRSDLLLQFEAGRIYKRLLDGNMSSVEFILLELGRDEVPLVRQWVAHNVTKDIIMLMPTVHLRSKVVSVYRDFLGVCKARLDQLDMIDQIDTLSGYERHVAFAMSFGKDPLTYHEWELIVTNPDAFTLR